MDNYPPGAANDSRAPWNQDDHDYVCRYCDNSCEHEDGLCYSCGKEEALEMRADERREEGHG